MEGEVRRTGGSQVAPVNPPLADPRGDVTEWDNASRCGPDDYGGGGLRLASPTGINQSI